jgi:hypothetical protein
MRRLWAWLLILALVAAANFGRSAIELLSTQSTAAAGNTGAQRDQVCENQPAESKAELGSVDWWLDELKLRQYFVEAAQRLVALTVAAKSLARVVVMVAKLCNAEDMSSPDADEGDGE